MFSKEPKGHESINIESDKNIEAPLIDDLDSSIQTNEKNNVKTVKNVRTPTLQQRGNSTFYRENRCMSKVVENSIIMSYEDSKYQTIVKKPESCEIPIDIFLSCTYEDGQPTSRDALTVYNSKILSEPRQHINEKKEKVIQYDTFDEKNGYNDRTLDALNECHGMAYYYSKDGGMVEIDGQNGKIKNNKIQMLICVTMYAEKRSFLENTLIHIQNNLEEFKKHGVSNQQIVVVVLQDGIMKMKQETVDFYSQIDEGLQRDKHLQNRIDLIKDQMKDKTAAQLGLNNGLPNTIPTRIALLYQNQIQYQSYSNDVNTFNENSSHLNVFTLFKHLNAKKLSSHMWFFEGFCRQFQPKYCALVDVGTLPARDGLVKFYMAMEGNKNIGGVCGFLGLEEPPNVNSKEERLREKEEQRRQEQRQKLINQKVIELQKKIKEQKKLDESERAKDLYEKYLINKRRENSRNVLLIQFILFLPIMLTIYITKLATFIVLGILRVLWFIVQKICLGYVNFASLKKAQLYEYTTAHMIDKNFESLLGFLHVLPGAWSGYRYQALRMAQEHKENLLQKKYLKQLLNPTKMEGNYSEANMFLAEDRVLCLGIYCQPNASYNLKYVPDAVAKTDPVDKFEEFVNQRRRWINSSWFALNYVLKKYYYHSQESSHSNFQKSVLLPFNMLFAKIGKFNTYFIPAFYLFVAISSSYQFITPAYADGYLWIPEDDARKSKYKCSDKYDEMTALTNLCYQDVEDNCYMPCSISDKASFFFLLLNFIPAIFVVCIIVAIFASLTFKIKDSKISDGDKKKINELEDKLLNDEISLDAYNQKKTQIEQNYQIQEYTNNIFKTLAAIISFMSLLVYAIVIMAVVFNWANTSWGIQKGFKKLPSGLLLFVKIMVVINFGTFFLICFFHIFQPRLIWDIIVSCVSYNLYQPIYNFILLIFAFCNIDDVTWGTKGITQDKESNEFYHHKVKFVSNWLLSNAVFLLILISANIFSTLPIITLAIGTYASTYMLIKSIFAIINQLKYFLYEKWKFRINMYKKKKINQQFAKKVDEDFNSFKSNQSYQSIEQIQNYSRQQSQFDQNNMLGSLINYSSKQDLYSAKQPRQGASSASIRERKQSPSPKSGGLNKNLKFAQN